MAALIQRHPLPSVTDAEFPSELHPLLRRVFIARGARCSDDVDLSMSSLLSPSQLMGIDAAADLIVAAIESNARVLIVGDFDADGATSCALAIRAFESMGHSDVRFIVPNRFEYGYGLTPEIVELAKPQNPSLIITVDNGISSVDGVAAARAEGIDVLVTDHHLPGEQLPDANVIVNPNQHGCEFPSKALAGVGVIFYVMSAVRTALRNKQWFNDQRPEPNMADFLDLVALGTVADVVPLDKNNRILVEQGLRRIRVGKCCAGIRALIEVSGRSAAKLVASDMGFALGPRLNAAGRLDDISIGIACLLTDDAMLAKDIATELDSMN
ncbi:MAG: DHH family phosphoesterase, partial [Pseudomonadales bacterium]